MKIWLNNREVKETDRWIKCNKCVFMRETGDKFNLLCLARAFNLQNDVCLRGYQYEDNV